MQSIQLYYFLRTCASDIVTDAKRNHTREDKENEKGHCKKDSERYRHHSACFCYTLKYRREKTGYLWQWREPYSIYTEVIFQ